MKLTSAARSYALFTSRPSLRTLNERSRLEPMLVLSSIRKQSLPSFQLAQPISRSAKAQLCLLQHHSGAENEEAVQGALEAVKPEFRADSPVRNLQMGKGSDSCLLMEALALTLAFIVSSFSNERKANQTEKCPEPLRIEIGDVLLPVLSSDLRGAGELVYSCSQ